MSDTGTSQTDPAARKGGEVVLYGIGISRGIAIGPSWAVDVHQPPAPEYAIEDDHVIAEVERFETAVDSAREQLFRLKSQVDSRPRAVAGEIGLLLDAHVAMLSGSRLIRGVEKHIRESRINAEYAVEMEVGALAEKFAAMEDPYIRARADDVREVGARLVRNLMGSGFNELGSVPDGGIVLAHEISPSETALMDPRRLSGFAAVLGGPQGHTAIMARSMGMPAVVGVKGLLEHASDGTMTIIDGIEGRVVINPAKDTLADYTARQAALKQENEDLKSLCGEPAQTTDGTKINLQANLEMPGDVEAAVDAGADGVGLLRTEFMFMNRDDLPDEDEQVSAMAHVITQMHGRPVTLRTMDVGGEKLAPGLRERFITTENPALGLRAIRLGLRNPELLQTQFRAMLRVSAMGAVRILLPMVTNADEMRRAREIYVSVANDMREQGVPMAEDLPPLGAMIEIPAAALSADALATYSDFFALGTNDLVQYTTAIDRANEQVAELYDPLNPAVLRLIKFTIDAGARAGIPVSVCGEMAGHEDYTGLLLGLGVRDLSVGPASLPYIKRRIRGLSLDEAQAHASLVLDQFDTQRIHEIVHAFNRPA